MRPRPRKSSHAMRDRNCIVAMNRKITTMPNSLFIIYLSSFAWKWHMP